VKRSKLAGGILVVVSSLSGCGKEDGPASSGAAAAAPGSARGFNVLLVTFDTARADAFGCYGNPDARTPVVDRLASRGVRFERTVSPAPITLPSHASLLTGLEPLSHGVRNNATFRLAEEHVTLAEKLREAGYATAAFVGSFVLDARYGLEQGFAEYDDEIGADASPTDGHFLQRPADRVTDAAIAWLGQEREQPRVAPFFLWVHYYDAHAPYQPPKAFAPPPPADPLAPYDPAENRARYLGEIAFADSQLGRLLDAIGEQQLERTLCVVTSDHGEALGEHGEFTHTVFVYRSTMAVPLIVSCPGLFESGRVVSDRIAGLVDVAPTVLSLAGGPPLPRTDGVDLFASSDPERAVYGESLVPLYNYGWAPLHFLERLDDKLIRAPKPEYFDLEQDRSEARNLYASAPPAARELEAALAAKLQRAGGTPARERELSPDEARDLAALGYTRAESRPDVLGVLDPKDMMPAWGALQNALTFSAQGDAERARATVESVIRFDPTNAFAWETAYVVHWRSKELDQAQASLERMLQLRPTADGFVRLAEVRSQRGDGAGCDAALALALELDPKLGEALLLRGDRHVAEHRPDRARADYEQAIAVDPLRSEHAARERLRKLDAGSTGSKE
jgi:choline-sulfatase